MLSPAAGSSAGASSNDDNGVPVLGLVSIRFCCLSSDTLRDASGSNSLSLLASLLHSPSFVSTTKSGVSDDDESSEQIPLCFILVHMPKFWEHLGVSVRTVKASAR